MKKHPRCQYCGDKLAQTDAATHRGKRICSDCYQRANQPAISQQAAPEYTCTNCGARFILATGEIAAHRNTRLCFTCWKVYHHSARSHRLQPNGRNTRCTSQRHYGQSSLA